MSSLPKCHTWMVMRLIGGDGDVACVVDCMYFQYLVLAPKNGDEVNQYGNTFNISDRSRMSKIHLKNSQESGELN